MEQISQDLADEQQALDALVSGLAEHEWKTITPFDDWTIEDEIAHLAYFDNRAMITITDPEEFIRHLEELTQNPGIFNEKRGAPQLNLRISELLAWWRQERNGLVAALRKLNPKDRVAWYGPTMSAKSHATARLMETWAHAQDIYDAFGVDRPATERLRHVAHLGIITFGWSYVNRKLDVPGTPVRVELVSPSGELWTWGPEDAKEAVKGTAQDFCLVVTQRRNIADTNLVTNGDVAAEWMQIAQAFAGPAETGPPPGSFPKRGYYGPMGSDHEPGECQTASGSDCIGHGSGRQNHGHMTQ
jgi:uncharacterized protein (TIGR03084 family)